MRQLLVVLLCTLITSCTIARPFYDSGNNRNAGLVSVGLTHAVLIDDTELRSDFWEYSARVINSLESQPGYIGHSLRRTLFGKEVWTMTVWSSEEDLDNFVESDVHTEAVREGISAIEEGAFARIEIPRSEVPLSWEKAEKLLNESNRRY